MLFSYFPELEMMRDILLDKAMIVRIGGFPMASGRIVASATYRFSGSRGMRKRLFLRFRIPRGPLIDSALPIGQEDGLSPVPAFQFSHFFTSS